MDGNGVIISQKDIEMIKLSSAIYILLFFCIFRVVFVPLVGTSYASIASGFFSIIIAFIFTFLLRDQIDLLILKVYSVVMLLPLFFTDGLYYQFLYNFCCIRPTFIKICIAFLETITPFIVIRGFSNKNIINKLMIKKDSLNKIILFFILLLLLGHILNLIGVPLPRISETPISDWGAQNVDEDSIERIKFRVSSFIGTSGPYSLSMAYLTISYAILNPNRKFYIFLIGFLVQIASFSRSGFVILLIYIFVFYLTKIRGIFDFKNFIPGKKSLLPVLILGISLIYIVFSFADLLIFQTQRIFYLLTLLNDQGNFNRLERMSMAIPMIFSEFHTFLIGFGTGVTSKTLGGEQFESQFVKVFVEWGFFGVSLLAIWVLNTFKLVNKKMSINLNYLPLASAVFFNLFIIQAFTSAPIFAAIGLSLLSMNFDENYKHSKILDSSKYI